MKGMLESMPSTQAVSESSIIVMLPRPLTDRRSCAEQNEPGGRGREPIRRALQGYAGGADRQTGRHRWSCALFKQSSRSKSLSARFSNGWNKTDLQPARPILTEDVSVWMEGEFCWRMDSEEGNNHVGCLTYHGEKGTKKQRPRLRRAADVLDILSHAPQPGIV